MPFLRFIFIVFVVLTYLGCSENSFKSLPNTSCTEYREAFGADACIESTDGTNTFNYSVRVGEVDILFVIDNSGSMYVEQQEMANRFPGFLTSIRNFDYQIAMITTDVSASPNNGPNAINQNGALQDGRFIAFPDGSKILRNASDSNSVHSQNSSYFQNTVRRPESANCDASGFQNCASGDERPIYAMNMALDRSENQSLFRSGGHLSVVILSDEDERSNGGNLPGYPLENYDLPETFVSKTKEQLHPGKTVSVHSIIIRPGDSACFNSQNAQQSVSGFYGNVIASLSSPSSSLKSKGNIINGYLGSICSNNYTTQLGSIASKIKDTLGQIQLVCKPVTGSIQVSFTPEPNQVIEFDVDSSNRLNLSPAVPKGTTVNLSYSCPK